MTADSPGYIKPPLVKPDGQGGAIVSWAAGDDIHSANFSIIQRIFSNGHIYWNENGTGLGWQ